MSEFILLNRSVKCNLNKPRFDALYISTLHGSVISVGMEEGT